MTDIAGLIGDCADLAKTVIKIIKDANHAPAAIKQYNVEIKGIENQLETARKNARRYKSQGLPLPAGFDKLFSPAEQKGSQHLDRQNQHAQDDGELLVQVKQVLEGLSEKFMTKGGCLGSHHVPLDDSFSTSSKATYRRSWMIFFV